jgi:hypothetical protein
VMKTRAPALALVLVMLLTACGAPPRYEFVSKTETVPVGTHLIDVALRNNLSGVVVEDAVITATSLDMAPDGMTDMKADIEPQGQQIERGIYRFRAKFTAAGRWRLSLTARVPGEPEAVKGDLIITVQ